jgi:hypothetical protein
MRTVRALLVVFGCAVATATVALDEERSAPARTVRKPTASSPTPTAAPTPPGGLASRLVSPQQISLSWQPVPNASSFRVYSSMQQAVPMTVRGDAFNATIAIPPNFPRDAVIRAWIETVAPDGKLSPRAEFPPIRLAAGGPSTSGGPTTSGPATTPSPSQVAGQQCPPGQFVTGFSSSGALMCAPPR